MTVLADLTTPAGVKALARAVLRSLRWCRLHRPREVVERIPAAMRVEDRSTYGEAIERVIPVLSRDGVMLSEAAEARKRMLSVVSDAVSRANLNVSRTYTNQYLTAP